MLSEFTYRDLLNHLSRFTSGIIQSKEFPRYYIIYQSVKKELDICCNPNADEHSLTEMDLYTSATISWNESNTIEMTVYNMLSVFDDRPFTMLEELDNPIIFPKGDIWMHRILHSFMTV